MGVAERLFRPERAVLSLKTRRVRQGGLGATTGFTAAGLVGTPSTSRSRSRSSGFRINLLPTPLRAFFTMVTPPAPPSTTIRLPKPLPEPVTRFVEPPPDVVLRTITSEPFITI